MNDTDCPVLGVVIASVMLFGFIHLVQRTWPPQGHVRGPSTFMRVGAVLAGAAGTLLIVLQYGGNPYITAGMPYCILFVVILFGYSLFGFPAAARSGLADLSEEQFTISGDAAGAGAARHLEWKTVICYGVLACMLAGVLIASMGRPFLNSPKLKAQATYPDQAAVGEEFKVTVDLVNPGQRDIPVLSLCLAPSVQSEAGSILDGARMTRIDPMIQTGDPESDSCGRFSDYAVGAAETEQLTFYFEGVKPGEFSTDILFYLEDTSTALTGLVITLTPRAGDEQSAQASCESCPGPAAGAHTIR